MKEKTYCKECGKVIKMLPFYCRCNHYFCVKHRYPETHDCNFNFKDYGKNILGKTLVKTNCSKINNI